MTDLGPGFEALEKVVVVCAFVFVSLGAWKLVDLVMWCLNHVSITMR